MAGRFVLFNPPGGAMIARRTSARGGAFVVCRSALVLVVFLVAACQGPAPKADPALTCQLTACTCVSLDRPFFSSTRKTETTEVLWRQNGAAYCPEGFELQPPKEKFRVKTYSSISFPRHG
jgi:hypothetical protein